MGTHTAVEPDDTEPVEETKGAPRGRWSHEVWLIITSTLQLVGEKREVVEPREVTMTLEPPSLVLGAAWARSKARRMVAAAKRRDVREGQPWARIEEATG